MKEQLISFETAKLAKEKGFEQNGFYQIYWEGKQEKTPFSKALYYKKLIEDNILEQETSIQLKIYVAPTQALLQKWLRETHRISVDVRLVTNLKVYDYRVVEIDKEYHNSFFDGVISPHAYPSYEGALEMGIVRALKLLKD